MSSDDLTSPFTLYHTLYSVRALMIRMMIALRGPPHPDRPEMNILLTEMDLGAVKPEQLAEFYLCNINPNGTVPTLTNDKLLPRPLRESLDITWYLCDWYPDLLPIQHETEIRNLLYELHEIGFPVLTFGPEDRHALGLDQDVKGILGRGDISNEYRKALEYKSTVLHELHSTISNPTALSDNESKVRKFCVKVVALMEANGTTADLLALERPRYIYGATPTALDAHVLIFLGRIQDAKRDCLLPEVLVSWIDEFRRGDIWKSVVTLENASTMPPHAGK